MIFKTKKEIILNDIRNKWIWFWKQRWVLNHLGKYYFSEVIKVQSHVTFPKPNDITCPLLEFKMLQNYFNFQIEKTVRHNQ